MKKSLADRIEQYIKVLISRSDEKSIEIQRIELAETFACVPSQVTYVISTRFTEKEGYVTESRRGGCGYVRISQFQTPYAELMVNSNALFQVIAGFQQQGLLTEREAEMIKSITMNTSKDLPQEYKAKVYTGIVEALKQYLKIQ